MGTTANAADVIRMMTMSSLDRIETIQAGEVAIDAVAALMDDGVARSAQDIAGILNRPRKTVAFALRRLSEQGTMQQMHVAYMVGRANFYRCGPDPKAARVAHCGKVPRDWPAADAATIDAFNAMARCSPVVYH